MTWHRKSIYVILWLFQISQALASPANHPHFSDPVSGQVVAFSLQLSSRAATSSDLKAAYSTTDLDELVIFDILEKKKAAWPLAQPREQLLLLERETDEAGTKYFRFQQVIKGVPVLGTYLFAYFDVKRTTVSFMGKLSPGGMQDIAPKITAESALIAAQRGWAEKNGSSAEFHYPARLAILDLSLIDGHISAPLRLVYEVDLGSKTEALRYLISGLDGSVIKILPLSYDATRRWVYDCSIGNGSCYLSAYSSVLNYTFGRKEGDPPVGANPIADFLIQSYPYETDSLYDALGSAHRFYFRKFKRKSANNRGGLGDGQSFPLNTIPAASYGDYLTPAIGCPNAKFNPMYSRLEFCAGLSLTDVVGHEFTHAVIFYSANLQYQGQSGALNESFADIFGEAIERFALGSHDWLLGASSRLGTLRSMANPSAAIFNPYTGGFHNGQQPDRAYSTLFHCSSADNGGVHTNSGVLNHAAYLIAAGGTFNGCSINGIGEEKMERIMYRALTKYLGPTSNFYDAYAAVQNATLDLYGWSELLEVRRALKAVELDQANYCLGLPRTDPGTDENMNGISDCNDPFVTGVIPGKPVLRPGKNLVRITMPSMVGIKYLIQVTTKSQKGRPSTTYYLSDLNAVILKPVSSGSSVTVSFRYLLEGQPPLYSEPSGLAKARVP